MSISSEILRITTLRNNIRDKLINLDVIEDASADLEDCYIGINSIINGDNLGYGSNTSSFVNVGEIGYMILTNPARVQNIVGSGKAGFAFIT